jgi:hypothetical protein
MKLGDICDVLCLKANSYKYQASFYVPLLGQPHIDPPVLGTDGTKFHWHLDYRFMTEGEIAAFWEDQNFQPGIHLPVKNRDLLSFRTESREMLREFRKTIFLSQGHKDFEKPYVGKRVVCGKCPHQGMDITEGNACLVNGQKLYICPGHHLVFNKKLRVISSPEPNDA